MLWSCLVLACSAALSLFYILETVRRMRHRTPTDPQSGPPSPEGGFKTIHKSLLLPGLKWTYLSPYYLRS
jgi:hypothetical protein